MKPIFHKNIKINFTDTGKGTTVVLLHGFLENHKMWDDFIPVLSKKNRIITIDLLGHGVTDCLGYVHTMDDMAHVVHSVLRGLSIRKAFFLGHSMGGYVALSFAELYSEYIIKGLVLINTTAKADSEKRKYNRDRAIKAVKQNHTNFISISMGNLFSPDNRDRFRFEIEQVRKEALKTSLQGIIAALEGMKIRKDRTVFLHQVKYPILFILGEKDPVLNYDETIKYIKDTNSQVISLPDGHMSTIENKEQVLKSLVNFLKETN